MSDNKLGCTDSYDLPSGPIGPVGPQGPQGQTPVTAPTGPDGDIGANGRSKVDILFQGESTPYITLSKPFNTAGKKTLLGTFIYPGNTALGGDPTLLKIIANSSGFPVPFYGSNTPPVKVYLVELTQYPDSYSEDDIVSNYASFTGDMYMLSDAIIASASITSYAYNLTSGLSNLADDETLIGVYIDTDTIYERASIDFYSLELY